MPLSFTCPACHHELQAPDAAAGREGDCKFCRVRIVAPMLAGEPATLASREPEPVAAAPSILIPPPGEGPSAPPYAGEPPVGAYPPAGEAFNPAAAYVPLPKRPYLAYADVWKRLAAYVVDGIIISILVAVICAFTLTMPRGYDSMAWEEYSRQRAVVILLTFWLYYTVLEWSPLQATLGKMWLGMKVVDTNGERLPFWRAAARTTAKFVSMFTCYIGYIMAMFNERSQALHDVIAGTSVVDS